MKLRLFTTTSALFLAGSLAATGLLVTLSPASAQTTQMDEPTEQMDTDDDAQEMETDDDTQQMGQQRKKRRDRMHKGYDRDGDRYHQRRMRHHGGRDGMMMGGMMGHGMGHGHMMRMMFIIADADGSGSLSLQEVQTVHERIFNAVDGDDDGEVTMEEMQTFMSDMKGGSKKGRSERRQQQQ